MTEAVVAPLATTTGPRPSRRATVDVWWALAVALVLLAPLRGRLLRPIAPQDDGLLLAYPDLVLRGATPNATFVTVYGPLTSGAVAATTAVFGDDLLAARLVALGYRVVVVVALYVLLRRVSTPRLAATAGVVAAGAVSVSADLLASAALGALAATLVAVASAARRGPGAAAVAGLFSAAALGFRADAALAVVPALAVLAHGRTRRELAALGAGALVGLVPVALNLAAAGPAAVLRHQILEPVLVSSPGRRLPLGSLPTPVLGASALAVVLTVAVLAVGARAWRHDPGTGRVLVALGLVALGTLPYLASRADLHHLAPALLVPLAAAPLAATVAGLRRTTRAVASGVVLVVVGAAVGPSYAVAVRDSLVAPATTTVTVADRSVPLPPAAGRDLQSALDALRARSPGRLAVVPADTSRAVTTDTVVYWLLPAFTPATIHLEMNPGVANAPGSSLAADLATADYVLTDAADDVTDEPNAAGDAGSTAANAVLATRFVVVGRWGATTLLERDRAVSPR